MDPSPQHVRTRGPARPRNIAAGVFSVAVIIAVLLLCGLFARRTGPDLPRDASVPDASAPAATPPPARP